MTPSDPTNSSSMGDYDMTLGDQIDVFELEAQDDYVGLWGVVRQVRRTWPDLGSDEVRLTVERICRDLLRRGVSLGQFKASREFEKWPSEGAVERVLEEWEDLGRDPNIGEIAWLRGW